MEITITSGFVSGAATLMMLITFASVFILKDPTPRDICAWVAGVTGSALAVTLLVMAGLLLLREETIGVCEQENPGTKCILEAVAKRT